MNGIFPTEDFFVGNWHAMSQLAGTLPLGPLSYAAIDFDAIKNRVCAYRGYRLCSVDAVTTTSDGRILFIEFKDVKDNPSAWLRKKAFDSLLLFWMVAGQELTLDQLRARAVFCYVRQGDFSSNSSDDLNVALQSASGAQAGKPLPYRLDELKDNGLFVDIVVHSPSSFVSFIQQAQVAQSFDEFKVRVRTSDSFPGAVYPLPATADSDDFRKCVKEFVSMRTLLPYDQLTNERDLLLLATRYDTVAHRVTYNHDWTALHPIMKLATTFFDTFLIWCAACNPSKTFFQLASILRGWVIFTGVAPKHSAIPDDAKPFIRDFCNAYCVNYHRNYGLDLFLVQKLYSAIVVCRESNNLKSQIKQ